MKKKLCLIETTKHRENLGSTLSHEHVHLLNAKVKHQVVVLADDTVDIEADPQWHILIMKYEKENNKILFVWFKNETDNYIWVCYVIHNPTQYDV